ncbi:MAG: LPXTG cell wall anchor domain-containing protein [Deltaproteobacteria bacterium]|nr:LPXTG cell wall anchor domain-containing protein [Deltaproteobacteria bacterium]
MAIETLGQFIIIGGLLLLVLGSWGRRRKRRLPQVEARGFFRGMLWTDILAYALVLAGLVIMWVKK